MRRLFLVLMLVAGLTFACAQRQVGTPGGTESAKGEAEMAATSQQGGAEQVGEQEMAKVESAEITGPTQAKLTEEEMRRIFQDIHFEFDKYDIQESDKPILKGIAEWMLQNSDAKLVVEGHCDERGTNEYNLGLGDRRASAARDYLQSLGVPSSRLQTVSYGEDRPLCTEHNEDCWWKNRRVHFVVVEGQ
ncbi:MAG: peptidoglycan-associated lipoprotein Pal [Nitrospirae bacterium]|nr:MAG: peptidoglycan-associated lipoprotein Pal [Nitrospirota bacterium]